MFATVTVRFALVAAALSSLTSAAPLFNFDRKEAVAMVRRAENDGQLAQGTNFYFTTLHLEDACSPGQVACVSGNYATCSGEGNWEITPCTDGTTCLATPASSPSGISIQCTSQETAQSSIQNAGGDPNTLVADFHVNDAPFSADTVASSTASAPASTATESSSAPTDTATPTATDVPTETASSTDSSASETETCIPDDGEEDGTIVESSTETALPTATETADPTSTCTDEEPVETETITVIVVPVPSSTGVYSTTTLFPEQPEPTVVGTDVPVPTESSTETEVASSTESSSESVPTESSSSSEEPTYDEPAPTETESSSESVPTESSSESVPTESSSESVPTESSSSSEAPVPTESASSSESLTTVTTIFIDPGLSIPALPTGTGAASTPVAIPVVSVVGTHTVPAKRMVRVVRRA